MILAIRALADNYVWLIVNQEAGTAVAVDPSEAEPVAAKLDELDLRLEAIWNTHHHADHVGGNLSLAAAYPRMTIHASTTDAGRIPGQTHKHRNGDFLGDAKMLFIPGHTLGHVGYLWRGALFCGDTLFGAGCGRLFEGTPAQMQASLARVRALPDDTLVYCGHEYTLHNLRFAVEVEPGNRALEERHERIAAAPEAATVPTRLGEEKATNPFLRWDSPEIMRRTGETDPVRVFAAVRSLKDAWRG